MEQQREQRRNWTVSGTARSGGGVFKKVIVRGEADVTSDIDCDQLKVMGTMRVRGDLQTKTSKVMGTLEVRGQVNGEEFDVMGELTATGDCNAETFKCRGTFDIDGLLNAGHIEVRLYGSSRAREIGGESIRVKQQFKLFPAGVRRLEVDTIEGDDIRLECTSARVVRGSRVVIGPGCDIELVEYKTEFRQDAGSKVGENTKI